MGRPEAERDVEGEHGRPRPRLQLGKYQLLAVLGRGGMAEVFLALSRGPMGFDKLAVIKRLRPGLAEDPTFRAMFLDEARLAARLSHPNVVHTYEVGESDGVYFIAMEYLEGQALNKILSESVKRGRPIEPVVAARIISDALLGLHHAHTLADFDGRPLHIIHRDISPHNLFVTYEGTTKVVDFGIAKAALSSTETEVGVLKGKVAYMSPEQAMGEPLDARSDVFAMGIVLWEMLTERRLMTGDSAASTIHRLMNSPVPPASSLRSGLAPSLDAIVARALERDPARRFPSALAMREELEAYIAASGRAVRNEEVGETVGAMFVEVRDAIKRQIQKHVEGVARAPLAEDSEPRLSSDVRSRQGMGLGGDLPVLGATGSGVVSGNDGSASAQSGVSPATAAPAPAPPASRMAVAGFVAFLLVLVVATSAATQLFLSRRESAAREGQAAGETPIHAPAATALPPASASITPPSPPASRDTPAPLPVVVPREAPRAPPPPSSSASPRARAKAPLAAPAPEPAGSTPAEVGYVTLDTYPWTRVSEGATSLGTTPIVHVALPAGEHTLTLDNPDQNIHESYTLTVKAGESTTKRVEVK